jgi:hypothetical protein
LRLIIQLTWDKFDIVYSYCIYTDRFLGSFLFIS